MTLQVRDTFLRFLLLLVPCVLFRTFEDLLIRGSLMASCFQEASVCNPGLSAFLEVSGDPGSARLQLGLEEVRGISG